MTTSPITETSVGNWMLPESRQTQARIEHAVTQTTANNQSAGPLRTLGVVARRALAQEIEASLRAALWPEGSLDEHSADIDAFIAEMAQGQACFIREMGRGETIQWAAKASPMRLASR